MVMMPGLLSLLRLVLNIFEYSLNIFEYLAEVGFKYFKLK